LEAVVKVLFQIRLRSRLPDRGSRDHPSAAFMRHLVLPEPLRVFRQTLDCHRQVGSETIGFLADPGLLGFM
jgi:hypothetical protein